MLYLFITLAIVTAWVHMPVTTVTVVLLIMVCV